MVWLKSIHTLARQETRAAPRTMQSAEEANARDGEGADGERFPSWATHRAPHAASRNSGPVPLPHFWPPYGALTGCSAK